MKKILALVLSLVMAFSLAAPAFAAAPEIDADNISASIGNVADGAGDAYDAAKDVVDSFEGEDYEAAIEGTFDFASKLAKAIHTLICTLADLFDFDCPFCDEKAEPEAPEAPEVPEEPEEPSEPVEIVPDEDWYTEEEPIGGYVITTAEEFAAFAQAVSNGDTFAGKNVSLGKDIDFEGNIWVPVGNYEYAFEGVFDGMDYTVSNLYINAPEADTLALFGVTENATIMDVNVNNVDITGYEMVAAIVAYPYASTVYDCHVTGDISLVALNTHVGGIASFSNSNIDNCSVIADGMGKIAAIEKNVAGGIVGWVVAGNNEITDCKVKNVEISAWANAGAIAGFVNHSNKIDGCVADDVALIKTREGGRSTIGLAAGGFNYNASKAITITNNVFKNITMTSTSLIAGGESIMYGAEYSGKTTTNFVMTNNSVNNIDFLYI